MEIIIISGRSGAGKSVANTQSAVAISLDIRNLPHSSADLDKILTDIQASYSVKIIFLDSDRSTLIRRYSDSRRLHPFRSRSPA